MTFSANRATSNGAGLTNNDVITLTNCTLVENAERSAIASYGSKVLVNTVLARNLPSNCYRPVTSYGHNLDDGDSCGFSAAGDITDTGALLGPLQDNGGSSWTHALLSSIPAIDAGRLLGCPVVDQRGWDRPFDGDGDGTAVCDIGAYELRLWRTTLPLVQRN